jgi:DNA-binding response OmpR family regulator
MAAAGVREILIVEDDAAISSGLSLNLRLESYATSIASEGETAIARIRTSPPDLVLLDISLPGRSGLEILAEVRQEGNQVPVIVLSARQDDHDKVAALRLGADDYVTKPFSVAELLARISAVLRRTAPRRETPDRTLVFSDVCVHLDTRKVTRGDAPVPVTHLEFELLIFFLRNAAKVLSREGILREVWGLRHSASTRTVDNFVGQLRAKLEADPERPRHLVTVRGSGYRFDP